jgi:hypothetical protein
MIKKQKIENRECKCKDWKKNIEHLNAGFTLMAVHGGGGYSGKKIVFCPWCGKKLKKVIKTYTIAPMPPPEIKAGMYTIPPPVLLTGEIDLNPNKSTPGPTLYKNTE